MTELEHLKQKYERLKEAVYLLELEREHERSPDHKTKLVELNKKKLQCRDRIKTLENE